IVPAFRKAVSRLPAARAAGGGVLQGSGRARRAGALPPLRCTVRLRRDGARSDAGGARARVRLRDGSAKWRGALPGDLPALPARHARPGAGSALEGPPEAAPPLGGITWPPPPSTTAASPSATGRTFPP